MRANETDSDYVICVNIQRRIKSKILSAQLSYFHFLTYKAKAVIFLLCTLCGLIYYDQFLISMFSLGMSIGKQETPCNNESLSKSISYNLNNNNNITCKNVV